MDATEAASALLETLETSNEGCRAWSPPDSDRNEFLDQRREELLAARVEPYSVVVHPDWVARMYGGWEDRAYEFFVVAEHEWNAGHAVLVVNPRTREFSLGSLVDGSVHLLGYHSPDALAEWID